MEARMTRPRSIVGPVILIGIGMIFLFSNLGLMDRNMWNLLFRFWPLILVAIGVDILVRRGIGGRAASLTGLVIALAIVVLLGAVVASTEPRVSIGDNGLVMSTTRGQEPVFSLAGPVRAEGVAQTTDGAERAVVELSLGVGQMNLGATSDSANLAEGALMLAGDERMSSEYRVADGTGYYTLRSERQSIVHGGGRYDGDDRKWDVRLNKDMPMQLKVNAGVGTARMNLSELHLSKLEVNGGVGTSTIVLPAAGQYQATINAGVGKVTVQVPRGMAARIQTERGLSSIDVQGNYRRSGNAYISSGYDGAKDRVELTVYGGVGKVSVEEY